MGSDGTTPTLEIVDGTATVRLRRPDKRNRIEPPDLVALWDHFDARNGPAGWVILPLDDDDKLAATHLSPEKRARQARRADYWIRARNNLRAQLRKLLQRPGMAPRLDRITQALTPSGNMPLDEFDGPGSSSMTDDEFVPSRVLETGPGVLDDD